MVLNYSVEFSSLSNSKIGKESVGQRARKEEVKAREVHYHIL